GTSAIRSGWSRSGRRRGLGFRWFLAVLVGVSVVGSSVLGMAQQFEHESSAGGDGAPEQTVACRAGVPVLNLGAPAGDPVALIDLGAIAHTGGERALAELISTSHAAPVGTQLARSSVDPQLYTLLTRLDLDQADDEDLVEAAAAAERLEAAAHAIKLRA